MPAQIQRILIMPGSHATGIIPPLANAKVFSVKVDNVERPPTFRHGAVLGHVPTALRGVAVQFDFTVVGQLNDMVKQFENLAKLVR